MSGYITSSSFSIYFPVSLCLLLIPTMLSVWFATQRGMAWRGSDINAYLLYCLVWHNDVKQIFSCYYDKHSCSLSQFRCQIGGSRCHLITSHHPGLLHQSQPHFSWTLTSSTAVGEMTWSAKSDWKLDSSILRGDTTFPLSVSSTFSTFLKCSQQRKVNFCCLFWTICCWLLYCRANGCWISLWSDCRPVKSSG